MALCKRKKADGTQLIPLQSYIYEYKGYPEIDNPWLIHNPWLMHKPGQMLPCRVDIIGALTLH